MFSDQLSKYVVQISHGKSIHLTTEIIHSHCTTYAIIMEPPVHDTAMTTVMDPGVTSTAGVNGNYLEPPFFITNKTNKGRYAIELKRWVDMIAVYAEDDKK